jgi:hypothetical protein
VWFWTFASPHDRFGELLGRFMEFVVHEVPFVLITLGLAVLQSAVTPTLLSAFGIQHRPLLSNPKNNKTLQVVSFSGVN